MALIPVLGSIHLVDTLPPESNNNPVVYFGARTSTSPNGEQIPVVMPCENAPVPRLTSGEPHCGPSVNQSSRVPEAISQTLSQNSSGTSQGPNTSSAMPSGQGGSAPDISIPSETSRLQTESPVHTHNQDIDQITGESLLEEVVPQKGPTTGGIHINLWGQNFPAVPLYVRFGDNWVRAVSDAQHHYPF